MLGLNQKIYNNKLGVDSRRLFLHGWPEIRLDCDVSTSERFKCRMSIKRQKNWYRGHLRSLCLSESIILTGDHRSIRNYSGAHL